MSPPLLEGTLFAGRYCIRGLIAQGGMGAVYEVVHTETNRRKALKVMHPHIFESDDLRQRFQREVRIAADIESDHIVDVSDAGVDTASRTPFMVMELLRGEDLGKRLKRLGPLGRDEVIMYLRQVALALDKTHAASIVHRDLKPDNLFLTYRDDGSPRIKILDFGVAKVVAEGATGQGTESIGTPVYMAPEQFYSGNKITSAADIFALGLVAYTLLVGVPYWRLELLHAGGLIPFITLAVHGPKESAVKRARKQGIELPEAFDEWFFRAVATKPEDRFGSAGETIAALEKVWRAKTSFVPIAELEIVPPQERKTSAYGSNFSTHEPIVHSSGHKDMPMPTSANGTLVPTVTSPKVSASTLTMEEAAQSKLIPKRSLLFVGVIVVDIVLVSVLGTLAYRSIRMKQVQLVMAVQSFPRMSAVKLPPPLPSVSASASSNGKGVLAMPMATVKPASSTTVAKERIDKGAKTEKSAAKVQPNSSEKLPGSSSPEVLIDLIGRP